MNKRFLALAGVATVLAVGTYVGLNIVKPYKHEEPKVADVTSPDQVFGASVDNPEAHADAAAAAPAAAGAAPAEAAAVQPADTAVQPASADQGGAAPAPATASADGSTAPLVPADAAGAAPAPAPSTETAAAEPAPAAAPAAAPEPAPAPAAEPAPAPAPAADMPAEKPKKAAHHVASSSKSSKSGSSAKVWWPAEQANKLSLVYAGPASFKKAVVLMFNGAFFKPDGIDANLKVTDKAGKAVSGSWEIGENNRRMLVFTVPAAGTYKVSIATGLTDSKGRKPGKALSGPVVIK